MNLGSGPGNEGFSDRWNALSDTERKYLRRQIRTGRPSDSREHALLAVEYARFLRSRTWTRLFWIWFIPGLVLSLGIASRLHPVLVGVVLALGAQAVFAHRNLARVEKVNAAHLSS